MHKKPTARSHFKETLSILNNLIDNEEFLNSVDAASRIISETIEKGKKIISCGNGGSMCDAMHFAEELSGKYREDRPAYPALALSDPSTLTCIGNDYGFENVFARQVEALGKDFDILLAISTSGNSPNILKAVEAAKKKDMIIIAMTGCDGGELANVCDHEIRIPWEDYADRIQEMHIVCIHTIISGVESQLKEKGL
ncbi:MAG: phosphoheptose isomerase [Crocinitomicaceae bacterium]|nr:phosphoheptose isomerase [Crocinitomicaceae bacterium]|tara:strand:+ start:17038 stop:17628 length:591 start_codon:yes stop_codon:yes gene_type:complete